MESQTKYQKWNPTSNPTREEQTLIWAGSCYLIVQIVRPLNQ